MQPWKLGGTSWLNEADAKEPGESFRYSEPFFMKRNQSENLNLVTGIGSRTTGKP